MSTLSLGMLFIYVALNSNWQNAALMLFFNDSPRIFAGHFPLGPVLTDEAYDVSAGRPGDHPVAASRGPLLHR